MTNPITPPPELVQCFLRSNPVTPTGITYEQFIATRFAQWGADQELEACCKWLPKMPPWSANDLRKHRRPKPPSLKEQALAILDDSSPYLDGAHENIIRRALEALDD